jgi:hypothetical protein
MTDGSIILFYALRGKESRFSGVTITKRFANDPNPLAVYRVGDGGASRGRYKPFGATFPPVLGVFTSALRRIADADEALLILPVAARGHSSRFRLAIRRESGKRRRRMAGKAR